MLAVQVQYWNMVENKRHNVATERETKRHNLATEDLGYKTLTETIRHNYAQEDYWNRSLAEQQRHNIVSEAIDYGNLLVGQKNAESNRLNALANQANAATNRMSALNSYSLGLEANKIAAGNLRETEYRNSIQREYNRAQIERLENQSEVATYEAITKRYGAVSQGNVNKAVAFANVANARTNQSKQQLASSQFKWNQKMNVWTQGLQTYDRVLDTLKVGTDVFQTMMNYQGTVQSAQIRSAR